MPELHIDFDLENKIDTRLTNNGNTKSIVRFPKGLKSIFKEKRIFNGIIGGNSEPIKIIGEMKFDNGILLNDVELEAEWRMPDILKRLFNNEKVFDNKGQEYLKPYFTNSGVPHLFKVRNSGIFRSVQIWNNNINELNNIFNKKVFDNPKPIKMIKDLICLATNKNSICLDFFAGSGTTGQAVMELNEEDGGNRQCILVTNNENNIGTDICKERLYRVVNGKGSNGEEIKWTYSKDKKCLSNNCWDVFEIKNYELKIDDYEKAKELIEKSKKEFKSLNANYEAKDFDIYNQLSSLKPFIKDEN